MFFCNCKSIFINIYFKNKWIKHLNKKVQIGRMAYKKKPHKQNKKTSHDSLLCCLQEIHLRQKGLNRLNVRGLGKNYSMQTVTNKESFEYYDVYTALCLVYF